MPRFLITIMLLFSLSRLQAATKEIQGDPDNTWVCIDWNADHPQWLTRNDCFRSEKRDGVGVCLLNPISTQPLDRTKYYVLYGPYEEFVGRGTLRVYVDFEAYYKCQGEGPHPSLLDQPAMIIDLVGKNLDCAYREIKYRQLASYKQENEFQYLHDLSPNKIAEPRLEIVKKRVKDRSLLNFGPGLKFPVIIARPNYCFISRMNTSIIEASGINPRRVEFRIYLSQDEFDIVIKKIRFLWTTKREDNI